MQITGDAIPRRRILLRSFRLVYAAAYVFAVLMSFPSVQPAVFLISFCLLCFNPDSKLQKILFLATPVLLGLKLPYFSISLCWLLIVQLLLGWLLLDRGSRCQSHENLPPATRIAMFGWCISWLVLTADATASTRCSQWHDWDPDRCVVCLGDSLTDYGYPDTLRQSIDLPVADFGFDGIETRDGVKLIPEIDRAHPQIVVIELGGHDYNKGKPRAEAERNLRTLIEHFQGRQVAVVLVEIPRGFISDPYFGLERQLAREYDLELIPDTLIRRFIFWSPIAPPGIWCPRDWHLSSDGLHPNQAGNALFAKSVQTAIDRIGSR